MHDFPTSLRMPRVRFGTCVLARVRVTNSYVVYRTKAVLISK